MKIVIEHFKRKPIVFRCIKQDGSKEGLENIKKYFNINVYQKDSSNFYIETLEGQQKIETNDYIIEGIDNEYYPISYLHFPMLFEKIYPFKEEYNIPQQYKRVELKIRGIKFDGNIEILKKCKELFICDYYITNRGEIYLLGTNRDFLLNNNCYIVENEYGSVYVIQEDILNKTYIKYGEEIIEGC